MVRAAPLLQDMRTRAGTISNSVVLLHLWMENKSLRQLEAVTGPLQMLSTLEKMLGMSSRRWLLLSFLKISSSMVEVGEL